MFILIPIFFLTLIFIQRQKVGTYLVILLSTVISPGIWYAFRFLQQGVQTFSYPYLPPQPHTEPFWMYPITFILSKQPIGIFMSFWGFFGWLDVPLPKWIYLLFLLLVIVAGIGWLQLFKNKKKQYPSLQFRNANYFIYISSFFLYTIPIVGYDITTFSKSHTFILQGRYFLPCLLAIYLLVLQGLFGYKKILQKVWILVFLVVFMLSQLVMFETISNHYYHKLTLISPLTSIYLSKK